MTREQQLDAVYRHTHSDFKGHIDGRRTIMVYRNGTCLVFLEDLTEAEIAERLPKNKEKNPWQS
ncbi:UNVERIFIED_ORG: hypothetical protein LHK14_17870 [Roseateles sp. XES5]|nr:hypothetical protein [Roseateles sp. XES5]